MQVRNRRNRHLAGRRRETLLGGDDLVCARGLFRGELIEEVSKKGMSVLHEERVSTGARITPER